MRYNGKRRAMHAPYVLYRAVVDSWTLAMMPRWEDNDTRKQKVEPITLPLAHENGKRRDCAKSEGLS